MEERVRKREGGGGGEIVQFKKITAAYKEKRKKIKMKESD